MAETLSGVAAVGDTAVPTEVDDAIYSELRQLARTAMSRERADHTLQPTALVNEAYLRLRQAPASVWRSRALFFSAAARVMRQVLIDHARTNGAAKRGGTQAAANAENSALAPEPEAGRELLLAIDEAIDSLSEFDSRSARVVELRYFAGLTLDQTAEVMGVSSKTVWRHWEFARVWLEHRLRGEP